jgi:AcrR family transcriptional regulator
VTPDADATDGLRERKKRETRIALSWAAIRLAVEHGFDNVRVEDIAAEVGVSPRTFRNYFSSKAEAIAARHVDRALVIADELRARPAGEPLWTAITNAVLGRFALDAGEGDGAGEEPPERWVEGVRLMLSEPALVGELQKASVAAQAALTEAIAERTGTGAGEFGPQLLAAAVGAAIEVATEHWMRADPPIPMATLLRDAFHRLESGLPVP